MQLQAILDYEASLGQQGYLGLGPEQFKRQLEFNPKYNYWEHPLLSDWFWEVSKNPKTGALEVLAGD